MPPVLHEEAKRVSRVEGEKHLGRLCNPVESKNRDGEKPHHHHGAEETSDAVRAVPLNQEEPDQNHDRDRHHPVREDRCGHLEPFDRAEDTDGRRDHALAAEQRGADDPEPDEHRVARAASVVARREQRGQREDSAFPLVVRAHHDARVLDGDDEDERVENERQDAEDVVVRGRDRVRAEEALADGVERARADVAVNDAQSCESQRKQRAVSIGAPAAVRVHPRPRE
jgi:hypothetical protein